MASLNFLALRPSRPPRSAAPALRPAARRPQGQGRRDRRGPPFRPTVRAAQSSSPRGETLYQAGRGLADVEARRPITPDSVFRLGSITKQFTAAVILQLVQEGRISLDDPVSRFLPDYPGPGASATVRQLLNHTSGIQSSTGIPGWMVGRTPPPP